MGTYEVVVVLGNHRSLCCLLDVVDGIGEPTVEYATPRGDLSVLLEYRTFRTGHAHRDAKRPVM